MPTAVQAFKLAQGFFLIPAMMAFSTLIWTDGDTIWGYVESILATVALIGAFAGAIEGQWATRLGKALRVVLAAIAVVTLFIPHEYRIILVAIVAVLVVLD